MANDDNTTVFAGSGAEETQDPNQSGDGKGSPGTKKVQPKVQPGDIFANQISELRGDFEGCFKEMTSIFRAISWFSGLMAISILLTAFFFVGHLMPMVEDIKEKFEENSEGIAILQENSLREGPLQTESQCVTSEELQQGFEEIKQCAACYPYQEGSEPMACPEPLVIPESCTDPYSRELVDCEELTTKLAQRVSELENALKQKVSESCIISDPTTKGDRNCKELAEELVAKLGITEARLGSAEQEIVRLQGVIKLLLSEKNNAIAQKDEAGRKLIECVAGGTTQRSPQNADAGKPKGSQPQQAGTSSFLNLEGENVHFR
ncbi:MAG: hypothetical protein OXU73_01045 [Candidatus Campbellbacteria bacterium]|nr:hypothetical protein [Candidatus Campbellbacteria bacterium]